MPSLHWSLTQDVVWYFVTLFSCWQYFAPMPIQICLFYWKHVLMRRPPDERWICHLLSPAFGQTRCLEINIPEDRTTSDERLQNADDQKKMRKNFSSAKKESSHSASTFYCRFASYPCIISGYLDMLRCCENCMQKVPSRDISSYGYPIGRFNLGTEPDLNRKIFEKSKFTIYLYFIHTQQLKREN